MDRFEDLPLLFARTLEGCVSFNEFALKYLYEGSIINIGDPIQWMSLKTG